VAITWIHGGLEDADLTAGGFDLVATFYPTLRRMPDHLAEHTLTDAVAPGGVLLVVHHADLDRHHRHHADLVGPDEVRAFLPPDEWDVAFHGRRERTIAGGEGAHHRDDLVLRARRRLTTTG